MKTIAKISVTILTLSAICWAQNGQLESATREDRWRVLPIRSGEEYQKGEIGGEGEQHFHGIARCRSNPDFIYLSQDVAQVWKSDNAGANWKKVRGEKLYVKLGQSIEVDPVNPNFVLVIATNHWNKKVTFAQNLTGLYRSNDGGDSWEFVLQVPTDIQRIYRHTIAYDPASSTASGATRWYAAFSGAALYRSEDGGNTWTSAGDLRIHSCVYNVQTHPSDGTTVYLASELGLFASTNRGTNLHKLGDLPAGEITSIAIDEKNPARIYAVLKNKGLYRSDNDGKTFSLIKQFDAFHVFVNPGNPDVIFLTGKSTNAIVSHDGGQTWNKIKIVAPEGLTREWKKKINGPMTGIAPNPKDPKEAVAYSLAGIWKTYNGGLNWENASTLFTGYAWSWWNDGVAFDVADPDRFCFFCCDISMVITENGGAYFTRRRIPFAWRKNGTINWTGMYAGDIQPIPGSKIIVGSAGKYFKTYLVRSTDAGANWTIVDKNYENNLFIAFHPREPNLVYAGKKRSFDAGATFQEIKYLADRKAEILGLCLAQPDIIYAMARPRNKILRSDDRGNNWRIYVEADWHFCQLDSKPTFAVDPKTPDKVYTIDRAGDLALFDGKNWHSFGVLKLAGGQEFGNFVRTVAVDPRYPNIIYAGMAASGLAHVWRTVDSGKTWVDISGDCPRIGATAMAVHPLTGDLMLGSAAGTWVFPAPYKKSTTIHNRGIQYNKIPESIFETIQTAR